MKKIIYDDGSKQIIDIGLHDYWNGKTYITTCLGKFSGCIALNPEYKKRKALLKSMNLSHVIPQKYLEVINFKPEQVEQIQKHISVSDYWIKNRWVVCA